MTLCIVVDVMPDGLGQEMWATACDDLKLTCSKRLLEATRRASGIRSGPICHTLESSFGSRAHLCPQAVVSVLRLVDDGLNIDRHHFDVLTVIDGPHAGKQCVAIGRSKAHRGMAGHIAVLTRALFEDQVSAHVGTVLHLTPPPDYAVLGLEFLIRRHYPWQPVEQLIASDEIENTLPRTGVWIEPVPEPALPGYSLLALPAPEVIDSSDLDNTY